MHSSGESKKTIFDKAIEGLLGSLIILMTLVIFSQILCRYVFNASLAWSEELARCMQIWLAFLGAALAVRRSSYIGMTELINKFPPKVFKVFQLVGDLAVLGFSVFCAYQGFSICSRIQYQTLPMLGMKMSYLYLAMPVSAVIGALYVIGRIIRRFVSGRKRGNAPGLDETESDRR